MLVATQGALVARWRRTCRAVRAIVARRVNVLMCRVRTCSLPTSADYRLAVAADMYSIAGTWTVESPRFPLGILYGTAPASRTKAPASPLTVRLQGRRFDPRRGCVLRACAVGISQTLSRPWPLSVRRPAGEFTHSPIQVPSPGMRSGVRLRLWCPMVTKHTTWYGPLPSVNHRGQALPTKGKTRVTKDLVIPRCIGVHRRCNLYAGSRTTPRRIRRRLCSLDSECGAFNDNNYHGHF